METGISGVGDMTARRRTTSSTEQGIKNRTDGEGAHLYIKEHLGVAMAVPQREQCGYYLPIYRWFQNQPELLPIFRRRGMRGRA